MFPTAPNDRGNSPIFRIHRNRGWLNHCAIGWVLREVIIIVISLLHWPLLILIQGSINPITVIHNIFFWNMITAFCFGNDRIKEVRVLITIIWHVAVGNIQRCLLILIRRTLTQLVIFNHQLKNHIPSLLRRCWVFYWVVHPWWRQHSGQGSCLGYR